MFFMDFLEEDMFARDWIKKKPQNDFVEGWQNKNANKLYNDGADML